MIYRQGDILLTKISRKPKGKGKKGLTHTLALGEFTGHTHILKSNLPSVMYGEMNEPVRYLVLQGGAVVNHQEHKQIQIPKGIYKVTIEKEFDYFSETIKQQRD